MKAFIIILGLLLGLNVQAQDFYLKVSSGIFKPAEMQSMQPNSKVAVQVAGPFRDANTVESSPPLWPYSKGSTFIRQLSYSTILGWQKGNYFIETGLSRVTSTLRAYSVYHGFGQQMLAQASFTIYNNRIPVLVGYEHYFSKKLSVRGVLGGNVLFGFMQDNIFVSGTRAWGYYEKNQHGDVAELTLGTLSGLPRSPNFARSLPIGIVPELGLGVHLEILEGLSLGLSGKWYFKTNMSLFGYRVFYKEFGKEREVFEYINYGNGYQIDLSLRYTLPSSLFKLKKE